MPQLKINAIIQKTVFIQKLEVAFLQFSKIHTNILSEYLAQHKRQKMLPNQYETAQLMMLE